MPALSLVSALCLLGLVCLGDALHFQVWRTRWPAPPGMASRASPEHDSLKTDRLYISSPGETRRAPSSSLDANRREVAKVVVSFAILYLTLTAKAQEVSAALQKRFGASSTVGAEPVADDDAAGDGLVALDGGLAYSESLLPSSSEARASGVASLRTKLIFNGVEIRQNTDSNLPIITVSGAATIDTNSVSFMVPALAAAVEGLRVGRSRRVAVPAALAFGAAGLPPLVPPGANVVFEVELC